MCMHQFGKHRPKYVHYISASCVDVNWIKDNHCILIMFSITWLLSAYSCHIVKGELHLCILVITYY